jgi:crooked neck
LRQRLLAIPLPPAEREEEDEEEDEDEEKEAKMAPEESALAWQVFERGYRART